MGSRLFHYLYMDILDKMQTDEGYKELQAELMGSASLMMNMFK